MYILPAIDLLDGQVVRLKEGDYDQKTAYALTPSEVAEHYREAGAVWIHMVDLNAARSGELTNTPIITAICAAMKPAGINVQCGGGIRNRGVIDRLLTAGVSRLVIGSAALKDWDWFTDLLNDPTIDNSRLALGLDARDGFVAAEGWTEQLDVSAEELAQRVAGSGLGAIVYTDIARDGMLAGVNANATGAIAAATDVPVIASGGVTTLEDVVACKTIGCTGAIIGKALYEGQIDLKDAINAAQ